MHSAITLEYNSMAKAIKAKIKLQIAGGAANPAPPVGTALGPQGVNIQDFCQRFNEVTRDKVGTTVPVEITIYEDRSFDFIMKTPPASELIAKAAGIAKGSGKPLQEKVGSITKEQVKQIAEIKMPDLNAHDIEAAMKTIEGTARQMGVTIK